MKRSGAPMGGVAQRARRSDAGRVQGNSALACLLVELWAWGLISAHLLQQICYAAKQDSS